MAESTSQTFIGELEAERDALYAAALGAGGGAARAEALLQQTVRGTFQAYASGTAPAEVGAWIKNELTKAAGGSAGGMPTQMAGGVMPAAVWARLTAAVQIEAAKLGGGKALNPDSVLLSPDPLLAPRKPKPAEEETEGLGLNPPQRFVLAVVVAILVGVGLTIAIATRWHGSPTRPAATAASQAATAQGR